MSWSTCTPPASPSPNCCRPVASTRSSRHSRSCRAARSAASSARRRRAPVQAGDRVAAFCMLGAWAETTVAPEHLVFKLPDHSTSPRAPPWSSTTTPPISHWSPAGNWPGGNGARARRCRRRRHREHPGRQRSRRPHDRRRLQRREGAIAREAGADEVVRSDGDWKDQAKDHSGGGVDVIIDPVGGDRFTDSLRALRGGWPARGLGFTGGSIPEVKVNRLLLNNISVVGAGWGASC